MILNVSAAHDKIQTTNFISRTSSDQYSAVKKRTGYLGMLGNLIRKWRTHANDFLSQCTLCW